VENCGIFKQRILSHEAAIVQPYTPKMEVVCACLRVASAAPAASLCAGHAQSFGGESPLANLMEVKA
jgi:hypothetical protein